MPGPDVPSRTSPDTPPGRPLSPRSHCPLPTAQPTPSRSVPLTLEPPRTTVYIHLGRPGRGFPSHHQYIGIYLSYISTDLFWTKTSPANTKVAFLPLGAHSSLWETPFYKQTHEFPPIQKILRTVTNRCSRVPKPPTGSTNCPEMRQLAAFLPTAKPLISQKYHPCGHVTGLPSGSGCEKNPPTGPQPLDHTPKSLSHQLHTEWQWRSAPTGQTYQSESSD